MRLWYPVHHSLRNVLWGLLGIQFLLIAVLIGLAVQLRETQSDVELAMTNQTLADKLAYDLYKSASELNREFDFKS